MFPKFMHPVNTYLFKKLIKYKPDRRLEAVTGSAIIWFILFYVLTTLSGYRELLIVLCSESLLVELGGTYRVLGIKTRSAAWKVSGLFAVL